MISIVVPNFNCGERLAKNLPKLFDLLKKSKLEHEVIVVDDASTDGSVETLTRGGLVNVVAKPKNTGFGTTVDRGIREAKGEIVFILNAIDILPESSDYFRLILEHFKDRKGLPAGRQVFSVAAAKKDEMVHGCGILLFHRGLFQHFHSFEDYKGWLQTMRTTRGQNPTSSAKTADQTSNLSAWADGGAEAIRKKYYLKIGGFDPLYKFYWEDVDLGYRAWKAGYRVDFEPKAILLHQKKEGPIAKYYNQRQRRIMNLRNQFIFLWKNADLKHVLLWLLWRPYHFLVALKNHDWDFFVAHWQAKRTFFDILARRREQKKVTKFSDDQILKLFSGHV